MSLLSCQSVANQTNLNQISTFSNLSGVQSGGLERLHDGAPGSLDELLDAPPERGDGPAQRVGPRHRGAVPGHLRHHLSERVGAVAQPHGHDGVGHEHEGREVGPVGRVSQSNISNNERGKWRKCSSDVPLQRNGN